MLIAVAAATIALVLVRQGLDVARTEATRASARQALVAAESSRASLEMRLAADPTLFLSEVLPNERARVCLTQEADTPVGHPVVEPGSPWPAECGATWDYVDPTRPSATQVEIVPPSPRDALLRIDYAARVGTARAGVSSDYLVGDRDRPLVVSGSDLDLADLSSTGSPVTGLVYANGTITTSRSVDTTAARLGAEKGYPSGANGSAAAAAQPDPAPSSGLLELRDLVPSPVGASSLRAAASQLNAIACADEAPAASGEVAPSLCLQPGRTVVDVEGREHEVPDARSWLLLPEASGTGTVDVYSSVGDPSDLAPCGAGCDLAAAARSSVATGASPGVIEYWGEPLGTFAVPASGVVATGGTTHVGLCGEEFLTPGARCAQVSGDDPGSVLTQSMTLVAGTLDAPADVYLSGPVATPGAALALVATGDVVAPYWSRSQGSELVVEAAVTALGRSSEAPVRSLPQERPSSLSGGPLRLVGSLSAARLDVSVDAFSGFALTSEPSLLTAPAPYSGGSALSWSRNSDERLGPDRISALLPAVG